MIEDKVILGLVDNSSHISCARLADKCRDLTLTWARYSYHGPVLEHADVDHLLGNAVSMGASYCLLLAYGQILMEKWNPEALDASEFLMTPENPESRQFLVAGRIIEEKSGWYGLDYRCALVNLERYSEFGRPAFDVSHTAGSTLPNSLAHFKRGKIDKLEPRPGNVTAHPALPGWQLIAESLGRGLAVNSIAAVLGEQVLDLAPEDARSAAVLTKHLDGGVDRFQNERASPEVSEDQATFLNGVSAQTKNAKRGVFLINIEPYTDVDQIPGEHWGPVSTLYSVAAGFKPNRILQTHGVGEATRVVFFDYSPNALEVKKMLLEEWDGEDFPDFVRYIFRRFPFPETYYQLWNDRTPDDLDWSEFDGLWQREMRRFGGEQAFRDHWRHYRTLKHDFVRSDILGAPMPLISSIRDEPNAVMWFSNAPFTVYSNWHRTLDERKRLYERFVSQIAERNPDMLLYGADYTNTSVNRISASEYWTRYQQSKHNALRPVPLNAYQIRS